MSLHRISILSPIQVYQSTTSQYLCKDKFYGRSLKPFDVPSVLYQFLFDGTNLRRHLIRPIVDRLRTLRDTLQQQDTFRFYSSSLLIMYEGDSVSLDLQNQTDSDLLENHISVRDGTTHQQHDSDLHSDDCTDGDLVDIRLIDFAHTTYKGFQNDRTSHTGPDHGMILGLDNLMQMFLMLLKDKVAV